MKYFIQTFGCQMNVYDSDSMIGLLNQAGHEQVQHEDEAELVLLNTCSIREGAETRVQGRLGQLKHWKDHGQLKYLGVTGCMGQKEGARLTDKIKYLDLVMGPGAIGSIPRLVEDLQQGKGPIVDTTGIEDEYDQPNPVADGPVHYPRFVSIMKGCNKKCTFCVVPNTRGPERSRDPHIILQEVESLAQKGYKEITLIGQTINSYRYRGIRFPQLLEMVNQVSGIERIRFTTSYPSTSLKAMIEAMASLDKICPQLHLPVQSGSNDVLKAMRRTYTNEYYLEHVELYRSLYKKQGIVPAITTDIIVGFPGETEDDFEKTLELMRTVRYDSAYMFKYSPRRGTDAIDLPGQIDEFTKSRRLERLIQLQNQIAKEISETTVGQTLNIMVERRIDDPQKGLLYEARARSGKVVMLHDLQASLQVGDILDVHIVECSMYTLFGETVDSSLQLRNEKIA